MSKPGAPLSGETLRALRHTLGTAPDRQVNRIVAMIDSLPERGDADALVAALRPRLKALRPPRPLNFPRLLFSPMEPVIVPAVTWRRGAIGIPRSTIAPLAEQVRGELGVEAAEIKALLEGRVMGDQAALKAAGERLWPRAAEVMGRLPPPANWTSATGLTPSDHATLAMICKTILATALDLRALVATPATPDSAPRPALRALVKTAIASGSPIVIQHFTAILLAMLPQEATLLALAGETATRAVSEQSIEFLLDASDGATFAPGVAIDHAAAEAARMAAFLDMLDSPKAEPRPARAARTRALRHQIDMACRARFEAELTAQLERMTASLVADIDDPTIASIELVARNLRRFQSASRRLGGGEQYDRLIRDAAVKLGGTSAPIADRARVVELLAGTDAALELLVRG